jgi:hypothetical protein
MTKNLFASLLLTLSLGACGGGSNADLDAFMKLDTDKAAAFAVGGKDCKAKAKSVGEWRAKHTADYKVLQKKLNDAWGKEPPKDVLEKHGEVMKANKKAVMSAMFACTSDPDFSKMMDSTKE